MKCEHYHVTAVNPDDKSCTNLGRCGPICNNGEQITGERNFYEWKEAIEKELHNKLAELNSLRPDCTLCENGGLHGCSESYCIWFAPKLHSKYKETE